MISIKTLINILGFELPEQIFLQNIHSNVIGIWAKIIIILLWLRSWILCLVNLNTLLVF